MTKFQREVQPNSWLVTLIKICIRSRKKTSIQWDLNSKAQMDWEKIISIVSMYL